MIILGNEITVEQVNLMKHTIGFDESKVTGTKNRIMHAYRNKFYNFSDSEQMQSLCKMGLMSHNKPNSVDHCTYWVTKQGFEFLAKLCGFKKIVEVE